MEIKFITDPVETRSGFWAVAYGHIPKENMEDLYDSSGNIRKKYIEEIKFFKRKVNAEKYKTRISKDHWLNFKLHNTGQLN